MIKLYKTYNKAKDVFVKPKLHWKFGLWKHDPCLPVWRRGPIIDIGGSTYKANAKCYQVKNSVNIYDGEREYTRMDGSTATYKVYKTVYHKLPNNLNCFDIVWKREYRKKWWAKIIPARLKLPIWLAFHIFNRDVTWKTKWTEYDIRYEYPPQFTIVFFGLSLSFWLNPEIKDLDTENFNHYWESLLIYLYGEHAGDLLQTVVDCGKWELIDKDENKKQYFQLSKNYIKPEYYEQYNEATELYDELIKNNKEDEY